MTADPDGGAVPVMKERLQACSASVEEALELASRAH